jgi:uncharacterized protein YndB with AHSA1/START domain
LTEETPAEETPAEETPAEETPAEEGPVSDGEFLSVSAVEDAPPPPGRRRFYYGLGSVVVFAVGALLGVRGTLANETVRNPSTSKDRASKQLVLGPDGRKRVRYARVLDHPPEAVWEAITSFGDYPEIFGRVGASQLIEEDDTQARIQMTVTSGVYGDWPFELQLSKRVAPGEWVLSWDQPGESVTVNRGGWTLVPAGPGGTLVVYEVDVEVKGVPVFFVRNVIMTRIREPIRSVQRWLDR